MGEGRKGVVAGTGEEQAGCAAPPRGREGGGLAPTPPGGDREEGRLLPQEPGEGEEVHLGDGKLGFGNENMYVCLCVFIYTRV